MVRTGIAAIVCSVFVTGSAGAAQVVVIDAKGTVGPTMAPGAVLDDASIDIPADAELTVMGADGEAVKVVGPHKGAIGGAAPASTAGNAIQALSAMMGRTERSSAFGATRDASFGHTPDGAHDPWTIDATMGGTDCIFTGRPALLWRPVDGAAARVVIESLVTHEQAAIDWPPGAATVPWPASVTPTDGTRYIVTLPADAHRSITLKLLPAAANPGAAALAAASAGCSAQSKLLLEAVKPSRTVAPT